MAKCMVTSETHSIECFILRLKHIHDQLHATRVKIYDDDFTIAALNGLPSEYDMIRTVLIARGIIFCLLKIFAHIFLLLKPLLKSVWFVILLCTDLPLAPHSGQGILPTYTFCIYSSSF